MHSSALAFGSTALTRADVAGKDVLEAGAMDVNGSLRPAIEALGPGSYLATDMRPGPGVDMVCLAENLPPLSADVVICTEMLEHAQDWRAALTGSVRALRPGGLLLLTTRSPGFPRHGFPEDYWRFPVETMRHVLGTCPLELLRCEPDPDPSSPGVFALARRLPEDFPDEADVILRAHLAGIEAEPVD